MPLPVKILRTRVSGPPGILPLWAVAGTAEGSMAPPAVSRDTTAAVSSAPGVGFAVALCMRARRRPRAWVMLLSVMVASFGVGGGRRFLLAVASRAVVDGVRMRVVGRKALPS